MRLGLLIRDAEYRDALAERLSSTDNHLFVNILDGSDKDVSYSLIVTDIMPEELDPGVLKAIKARTVFLSDSDNTVKNECLSAFKYDTVSSLISEFTSFYNEWHGPGPGRSRASKRIGVCSETDMYSGNKCMQLARHIIYGMGGRVIVISLSYINDYGKEPCPKDDMLARLLYSIRTGRHSDSSIYTYTDSYGISYMSLPPGLNPAAYLNEEELKLILAYFETRFDAIICDTGTCYRKENVSILKDSDSVIYFELGRRETGIAEMLGESAERLIRIKAGGGPGEAAAIDESIRKIYGTERNDS